MRKKSKNGRSYDPELIGLEVNVFPKNIRWMLDYDYIDKLRELAKGIGKKALEAQAALKWLSRFNNERYGAKVKKDDPNAIHRSDVLTGEVDKHGVPITMRRDCYIHCNRARIDLIGIKEVGGLIEPIEELRKRA